MGTVHLACDGTLFIACGNTLSKVQGDERMSVQCGVEEVLTKEEPVKEDTMKPKQQNQKMIKKINKQDKEKIKQQDKEKEAALFGLPHIVGLDVGSAKCAVVSSNKVLEVWHVGSMQRLATTLAPKRPTAVQLTKDQSQVVVSDKSGDVYLYNIELSVRTYLLGHVSMVLDITLSPCNGYLVTCDRDEKVRVSNFPNCYNVHQYCLGHTEYVSAACYLSNTLLASISGDKSLKLWDTSTAQCLHTLPSTPYTNLHYNGQHLYTSHTTDHTNEHTTSVISVYELSDNKLNKVSEAEFNAKIVSFSVNKSKCLLLTNDPKVITAPINSGSILVDSQEVLEGLELKGLVNDQVTVKKTVPVDERTNDYFDRKRRRIEEENKAAMDKEVAV